MKVLLIGVHYCEGKYRATKTVEEMLKSVGHELVTGVKEDVTICLGRLMPFDAPKKPDSLLKAESLGLAIKDLDALMGVQAAPAVQAADDKVVIPEPVNAEPPAEEPKAKGERAKKLDTTPRKGKKSKKAAVNE
jgi:hypothetical protein